MKLIKIKIPIQVYDCELEFRVAVDVNKEYSIIAKRLKVDLGHGDLDGCFLYGDDHGTYYMLIGYPTLTHNTIAHEIYHAATQICEHRAIEEEESRAWLAGYLTAEIYKFLNRKKQLVKHE